MTEIFRRRTTRLALSAFLLLANACGAEKGGMAPPVAMPSGYGGDAPAQAAEASPMPGAPGPAQAPTSPAAHVAPKSGAAAATPTGANAKQGDAASRAAQEAMLIYTGELHMQADEDKLAATLDQIIDVAEGVGGRITGRTDTSVVVSVPSARFREAMTKMEPVGTVTHRSVSAQDVTEQYHDAEVRLQNLRATRQRMQEFLAKAGNIADTLTVERELERVAQEIDVLEGKLRFLKERAAFSQISVSVSARPKAAITKDPPPPAPPPPPPPQRLLDLPVEWFNKLGINRLLDLR